MAAASEDLWAVKGGNHQVAEGFLKASATKLSKCQIDKVKQTTTGQFQLYCGGSQQPLEGYTHVVIATPLMNNGPADLKIETLKPIGSPAGTYKKRYATLVKGTLKSTCATFNQDII